MFNVPPPITERKIDEAAATLAASERGRQAMTETLAMLDNGGMALDGAGQHALLTLLVAAFTTHPGSARDAMRNACELHVRPVD